MRDTLIHLLSIKGFAKADILAEALGCPLESVASRLEQLSSIGLLEETRMGMRLSVTGKEEAQTQLAAQREAGDRPGMESLYASFDVINRDYKAALASWQMREGPDGPQPNDHSDADYDATVKERMFASDGRLAELLRSHTERWPLLGLYADRLQRARERVDAGEQRYVAAPLIDSYHTVWFELHEALIRLSGRDRASEAAAGRAV